MSFENTAGIGVSNHYGARDVHGAAGSFPRSGNKISYAIKLDGEKSPEMPYIMGNSRVVRIWTEAGTLPSAVNTVKAGSTDITSATADAPVKLTTGGEVVIAASVTAAMKVLYIEVEQNLAS